MVTAIGKGGRIESTDACAYRIIDLARQQLDAELPELQPAVFLLPAVNIKDAPGPKPRPATAPAILTDSRLLYYYPERTISAYREDRQSVTRMMLHILMHGLLGHFEKCAGRQATWYSAAADLEVTDFLLSYARRFLRLRGEPETGALLRGQHGRTAEETYAQLSEWNTDEDRVRSVAAPLESDMHMSWLLNHLRCYPSIHCAADWEEAACAVALNLRDAGRDGLAERLEGAWGFAAD
ncbi:MAG: hypothetical protein IJ617_00550 [Oscillospiraceae bacterium]|nr:hypothetical protein [Oscillospiraceae bacterium]